MCAKAINEMSYRVWDSGTVREGSARDILEQIRTALAGDNEEISKMDVTSYARALIEDAPYFVDQELLKALRREQYPTDWDRALHYLASMPSSRVRILSWQGQRRNA